MSKVAAIIVDFKTKSQRIVGVETIIVDNTINNVGFATGANRGIKQALEKGAKKILLVNPDVRISKKDITELEMVDADIVSPVLKFRRQGKWVYDFGGKVNWIFGRTTHMEKEDPIASLQDDNKIDYVSGACMMVDRKVFEKIGFFDERFFLYFEDVDFCLRAKQAGFNLRVNPNIIVEHQIEEHRFSKDSNKFKLAWESNLKFVLKWVSPVFWPVSLAYLGWLKKR